MDYQTISRVGTQLGAVLVIATAAQTATAQTVPAFCTSVEDKALYSFSVAAGERLAEQFIEDATGTDGLSCAQLVTVFLEFDDFVREFRAPPCQGAGLRDGGQPVIDTAICAVEHPGGIFESNEALEELRGVTRITGDLQLRDGVSDLSALSSLETVGGDLDVGQFVGLERRGTALTSLAGLDKLTEVGGALLVSSNDALTSLTGLNSLTSVGGFLTVGQNPALTSLAGLESLTSVGSLSVVGNNALRSLTGLDSLTSVGGFLAVSVNRGLTSLTGLENLTSVGGFLAVGRNPALTSLAGLESLTSVGGRLLVQFNSPAVTSLDGLPPQFHSRVEGF